MARPRQHDLELSEKTGLRLDIDAATVLFYDDVVARRQAKPGTFARGLSREERVEYFLFDLCRDAGPVLRLCALSPGLTIPFAIDSESSRQAVFAIGFSPTITQITTGC